MLFWLLFFGWTPFLFLFQTWKEHISSSLCASLRIRLHFVPVFWKSISPWGSGVDLTWANPSSLGKTDDNDDGKLHKCFFWRHQRRKEHTTSPSKRASDAVGPKLSPNFSMISRCLDRKDAESRVNRKHARTDTFTHTRCPWEKRWRFFDR